jgi:S-adenosylmethionine:diacylglycerol 3-amino-3-carboxypropyl transferase
MGTLAARAFAAPSPWRNVVRAMSQTGGASLLSGLLSMLATKIIAVTLGPAHVATLSTLQQLRLAAVTGSTLTGQTALVQGASSSTGLERREFLRTVLDNSSEAAFKARLTENLKDKTLVLITHRSSLLSLVDRLIVVDNGKVMADGKKEDVLEALKRGHIRRAS